MGLINNVFLLYCGLNSIYVITKCELMFVLINVTDYIVIDSWKNVALNIIIVGRKLDIVVDWSSIEWIWLLLDIVMLLMGDFSLCIHAFLICHGV